MKRLLLLLLFPLCCFAQTIPGNSSLTGNATWVVSPASVAGPYVHVQDSTATGTACNVSSGTSCTITFGTSYSVGHLLVVGYASFNGDLTGCTDASSDVMSHVTTASTSSNYNGVFYVVASGTGTTISCTFPGTNTSTVAGAAEFSGNNSSPLDTSSSAASGTGTAVASASLTPAKANELFVATCFSNNDPLVTLTSAGWTNMGFSGDNNLGFGYIIASGAGAQQATWTNASSQSWTSTIVAFK